MYITYMQLVHVLLTISDYEPPDLITIQDSLHYVSQVDDTVKMLYLNKPYQPPPAMRSWETIKENPPNKFNVFSSKRHVRLLTFEVGFQNCRLR